MTTETLSPLTQRKRCSLPGPIGGLNLHTMEHSQQQQQQQQQRRHSARGLMIYKPNKPDIDLIRDFTNPSKKLTPSFICDPALRGYNQKRRHSAITNVMMTSSTLTSIPSGAGMGNYYNNNMGGRRHSCVIPSTTDLPPPITTHPYAATTDSMHEGAAQQSVTKTSFNMKSSAPPAILDAFFRTNESVDPVLHESRLLSKTCSVEEGRRMESLRFPQYTNRRFSDSTAILRQPPHICITAEGMAGGSVPMNRSDAGIVCSTGDLLTLKCLTSSAQEIRCPSNNNSQSAPSADLGKAPQSLGGRSRSFDSTVAMARKGAGSSWLSRRHQPIAVKFPLPILSPTISSPGETHRFFPDNAAAGILVAPLLTITNESRKSKLIEIPSPPEVSPNSSGNSPEEGHKVAWDKTGFLLDADALGIAIEKHLRRVDVRRGTGSALTLSLTERSVRTRNRSASASVIIPLSDPEAPSTASAGSSKEQRWTGLPGPVRKTMGWRKASLPSCGFFIGGGGPPDRPAVSPGASTSVTFSEIRNSSAYETHLHRVPVSGGTSAVVTLSSMGSPTADSFINFQATEEDIEEDSTIREDEEEEEEEEPKESQAFLQHQPRQSSPGKESWKVSFGFGSSSSSSSAQAAAPKNERTPGSSSSNNTARSNAMSICTAMRDFILQSIRS